jgi:2-oxoglutarate ferredoxin oxidoreductase subunit alpha
MSHDETGLPKALAGQAVQRMLVGLQERMRRDARDITYYHEHALSDAEVVLLTYGITARAAREAVDLLRQGGVRAGLLDLQTLWPFPDELVLEKTKDAKAILVPELNLGQYVWPVQAAIAGRCPVKSLGRADGELFTPETLRDAALELAHTVEIGGVAHA